jgi:hypothetical protein
MQVTVSEVKRLVRPFEQFEHRLMPGKRLERVARGFQGLIPGFWAGIKGTRHFQYPDGCLIKQYPTVPMAQPVERSV